ncbi:MAG: adenine phosphoribosyltransferase [Mycoplasma sp.]|nr:adenine phosphoribosyltransferase [Mycoplasma sp.]
MEIKKYIRSVKNFPKKGIGFKDISPILTNPEVFSYVIDWMSEESKEADVIVAPDARGFLFATPVSYKIKKPFVMVRKPGKLPMETVERKYDLEYGSNTLQMHKNSIKPGQKVIIIDDLLATGGTTKAIISLIEEMGGKVIKLVFLVDLLSVAHVDGLEKYKISKLIEYN